MPIGMILFVLDIVLVVHAAKTGRFSPWGYLIIVLPGIGAFIYVVAELLPEWLGSRNGRAARQSVARAVNPGRRYRQLTEELAIVDTIANRAALAGECLTLGKFEEALAHYEMIIAQPLGEEPHFFLGKARAQCALGQPAGAVATLDDLMRRWPNFHSFDGHLLYAIALEESGRADEALAHYAKVGQYYPGAEPRVRQAQLLRKLGRNADAKALAEDIVRGLSRAPSHVRRNQREWLANAQRLARG
ncbi:MAG: tetratricopeptide repeat protein [Roseiarcus sp.]